MATAIKSDKIIDVRGLTCPMPLLKTKIGLGAINTGQILEIWGTDHGSKKDIPDFARKKNHKMIEIIEDCEGYTKFYLQKG